MVGVVSYANGTPGDDGKVSPTALIPAFVGAVLALCGLLAFSDKLRKHAMHFAAIIGLLGAIGGFMPLQRQLKNTGTIDPLKPSAVSGELMILICIVFVALCNAAVGGVVTPRRTSGFRATSSLANDRSRSRLPAAQR